MLFGAGFCEFDSARRELRIMSGGTRAVRYRVTSWDSGMDVFRDAGDGWRLTSSLDEWSLRVFAEVPRHPVAQYYSMLPPEAVQVCGEFDYYQLGMLRMLRRFPNVVDLLHSIPALAWLLPRRRDELGLSWDELEGLCSMRRKDMLQCLFGHGSKSLVNTLVVVPFSGARFDYDNILAIVRNPELQAFLRRFPKILLRTACRLEGAQPVLTHRWFRRAILDKGEELSRGYVADCVEVARDIVRLGKALGFDDARLTVSRCPDIVRLFALHDRWTAKINSREMAALARVDFPPPPLEGDLAIIPITNALALAEEGREMSHCVAGYTERVLADKCYIYKVIEPERGTLEIRIRRENGQKRLSIGQFRLFENQSPGQNARRMVREWFDGAIAGRRNKG